MIYLWHPRSRGIKPVHEKLSKVRDIYIYIFLMLVEVNLYLYPRTGGSQLSRGEERNAESEVVFRWWWRSGDAGFPQERVRRRGKQQREGEGRRGASVSLGEEEGPTFVM